MFYASVKNAGFSILLNFFWTTYMYVPGPKLGTRNMEVKRWGLTQISLSAFFINSYLLSMVYLSKYA